MDWGIALSIATMAAGAAVVLVIYAGLDWWIERRRRERVWARILARLDEMNRR